MEKYKYFMLVGKRYLFVREIVYYNKVHDVWVTIGTQLYSKYNANGWFNYSSPNIETFKLTHCVEGDVIEITEDIFKSKLAMEELIS